MKKAFHLNVLQRRNIEFSVMELLDVVKGCLGG